MIQKSKVIGYGDPYATVAPKKHKSECQDCHREVGWNRNLYEHKFHNTEKGFYSVWLCGDCTNEINNSFS